MYAGIVVKVYLAYLVIGTLSLLAADVWLIATGRESVTVWLRSHPHWYDYALAVALFLNSLLFIHLFRSPPRVR